MLAVYTVDAKPLLVLHRLDGTEFIINTKQLIGLTTPKPKNDPNRLMHSDVNCVVNMTNGKYLGVKETCHQIHEMVEKEQAKPGS